MMLSPHSKNLMLDTLARDEVPKDYADPIFNYLVYGFHPGSFWTSVLANDFMGAMARSHPGNSIPHLKHVVSWMMGHLKFGVTHGSYEIVGAWLQMTDNSRRENLETLGLIYPEDTEIMMILKNEPTHEPHLW